MHSIKNESLLVTAQDMGAELVSIEHVPTGRRLLWEGDPAVWSGRAPLLFPYCGNMSGNVLRSGGREYPASKHGFARESLFEFVHGDHESMRFRLAPSPKSRQRYPYTFLLEVTYRLDGNSLVETVEVQNPLGPRRSEGLVLPFSVGFHPAFSLPLEEGAPTDAHEIAFEVPESPVEVKTPEGMAGEEVPFAMECNTIPLTDSLFDNDSICLTGLKSRWVELRLKDNRSRRVRVDIEGFPYLLLWSMTGQKKLRYLCIEPWHSLPDAAGFDGDFSEKPGLCLLEPGQQWATSLVMEFGV